MYRIWLDWILYSPFAAMPISNWVPDTHKNFMSQLVVILRISFTGTDLLLAHLAVHIKLSRNNTYKHFFLQYCIASYIAYRDWFEFSPNVATYRQLSRNTTWEHFFNQLHVSFTGTDWILVRCCQFVWKRDMLLNNVSRDFRFFLFAATKTNEFSLNAKVKCMIFQ